MAERSQWTPLSEARDETLASIEGICFDVDDTFSSEGKITDVAFSALWRAARAGLVLVPVTGRPAGWCDHFARFWPVHAVVGENGAFSFFMHEGVRRRLDTPMEFTPEEAQQRLAALRDDILRRFPHASWASDQSYREYDLAIDVYEDVEDWPESDVDTLLSMCREAGAQARLSSVHVNTWFGSYDKFSGFTEWLKAGSPGAPRQLPQSSWVYLGDSPNDEPMFARFERSVGVANVLPFRTRMTEGPRWVTTAESGSGFAEFVDRLLRVRGS